MSAEEIRMRGVDVASLHAGKLYDKLLLTEPSA